MTALRYISEADHTAISEIANSQFADRPEYRGEAVNAFVLRGQDGHALLSSALDQPRWPHHRTLQRKAGVLQYHLNVNHPFVDGNKRFALTAMIVFLARNQAFILASEDELYETSIGIADGGISRDALCAFIERRTVRTTWSPRSLHQWRTRLARSHAEERQVKQLIGFTGDDQTGLSMRLWFGELARALAEGPGRDR